MHFIRPEEQNTDNAVNQGFDGRPAYPTAAHKEEGLNCGSQLPHTSVLKRKISVFWGRPCITDRF